MLLLDKGATIRIYLRGWECFGLRLLYSLYSPNLCRCFVDKPSWSAWSYY
jgi:hypothetical protein